MARNNASRLLGILVGVAFVAAACGSPNLTPTPTPATTAGPTAAASPTPNPSPTASPSPSPAPTATPTPAPTPIEGIPAFKHVYVIIMENKEYGSIVGSKAAPYENALIAKYGLATNYFAVSHPSEPNYIALTSGGLNGVTTDGYYILKAPSIFDQIDAAGHTWHVYAQDYPGNCYTKSVALGGVDGWGFAGEYARKHNPAISFASISTNKTRCADITHLAGFNPAAADFEMIIPNLINDMHSSSVAAGDAFLKLFVPRITGSAAFAGSVLFITWDEGGTSRYGGGATPPSLVKSRRTGPARYSTLASHYSLLRTIEDAWRMPYLGSAAAAKPLAFSY